VFTLCRQWSRCAGIAAVALIIPNVRAAAQVLTTAETLGKGTQAVAVSWSRIYDSGEVLNIPYLTYSRGLSSRFDVYAMAGETFIADLNQGWVGLGANARIVRSEKVSVSVFAVASAPVERIQQSSTALVNAALLISRPIVGPVTLYSGLNALIPVGAISRGVFTPIENKVTVPIGSSFVLGKWNILAEADFGQLTSFGLALALVW
jgi:hypothetical protein